MSFEISIWAEEVSSAVDAKKAIVAYSVVGDIGSAGSKKVTLSDTSKDATLPQVAVDPSGNAIAIWLSDLSIIYASYYDATSKVWTEPKDISTTSPAVAGALNNPEIAINASGNAIVSWTKLKDSNTIIQAVYYTKSTGWTSGWSSVTTLPNTINKNSAYSKVGIDDTGNAIVTWIFSDTTPSILSKKYTKSSGWPSGWSSETTVSDSAVTASNELTMNNTGNAIAVWNAGGTIKGRYYSASSGWSSTITSISGSGCSLPSVKMNNNGQAVAAWVKTSSAKYIQASKYVTNTWSTTPSDITSTTDGSVLDESPVDIDINDNGQILAIWGFFTSDFKQLVQSSYTTISLTAWANKLVSDSVFGSASNTKVSLDNSGTGYGIWEEQPAKTIVYSSKYSSTWSTAQSISTTSLNSTGVQIQTKKGVPQTTTTTTTIPTSTTSTTTIPGTTTTTTTIPPVVLLVDQAYVDRTNFPVTVGGGTATTPSKITLVEDIVTSKPVQFIINTASSYVTFNGQGHTITLNGVTNYPGLIQSSSTNTIVRNVGVLSTTSSLTTSAGWIGSLSFAGKIDTCYSNGNIAGRCGGIVGSRTSATIKNCFSTGTIGAFSGGIASELAGISGLCTITNCFSTGEITGVNAGGIAGASASKCHVTNCYTLCSTSSDLNNGTIFGNNSGTSLGDDCEISNCYTAGLTQENNTINSNTPTPAQVVLVFTATGSQPSGSATNPITQGYQFNNNLTIGSRGADVSTLQTLLISLRYSIPEGATGYFGQSTKAAVVSYQAANGIPVSAGYVGPATRASLNTKTGITVDNSTNITGVKGYRVVLTTYVSNYQSSGWNDAVAYRGLDTAFFKVSPGGLDTLDGADEQGITNVPFKLLAFLYSASTSQLSGPILTYNNIWSMASLAGVSSVTSATITNNSGVNTPTTTSFSLSTDGRSVTLNFGGQFTPTPTPYCLLINDIYVDKFELVSTTTVFFRLIGDFYTVIVDANSSSQFIQDTKTALATALGISEDLCDVLALSEGSIAVQALIPTPNVDALGNIIKSGKFTVNYDGKSYPAITDSFRIIDTTCFYRDTLILTPNGYRKVQDLSRGDLVRTAQGREVAIKRMISFTGTYEKCPLYVIQKDALGPNVPLQDLYMSDGHAFRNGGNWYHMKCSDLASKVELQTMEYYNIVLDNYMEHTLVANGVEVESLFDMKGLKMHWRCEEECCKPVIEKQ
jgi:peptidoglycan hydrolase-like protein with peptidoglycan-binding domain